MTTMQSHHSSRPSGSGQRTLTGSEEGHERPFHFTTAIVCRVSNSLAEQTSFDRKSDNSNDVIIDVPKCRTELERLVDVLRHGAGLDVVELPSDEQQPDGVSVGDIAVVIGGVGLICNPPTSNGRPSRHGEKAVVRQVLRKELGLKIVEVDSDKAIVEGGDVLWTGREIFVGLSSRTNMLGAQAVAKAFPEYSTNIVHVHPPATHLKDYINIIQPEVFVVSQSPSALKTFKEIRETGVSGYQYIMVSEDRATNVIFANNTLLRAGSDLVPADNQVFANKLNCRQLDTRASEILKRGSLSDCVILVNKPRKPRRIHGYQPPLAD